jgi:hypothetical protein
MNNNATNAIVTKGGILAGGVVADLIETQDNQLEIIFRDGLRTEIKSEVECNGMRYVAPQVPEDLRHQIRFPRSVRRSCDPIELFKDTIWLVQQYLDLSEVNAALAVAGGFATWIPEAFSESLMLPVVSSDSAQAMKVFDTFCRRPFIFSRRNLASALLFQPTVFLAETDYRNFKCPRVVFFETGKADRWSRDELRFYPLAPIAKTPTLEGLLEAGAADLQPSFQCYRIKYLQDLSSSGRLYAFTLAELSQQVCSYMQGNGGLPEILFPGAAQEWENTTAVLYSNHS